MLEPLPKLAYEVCHCLKWKGLYIDSPHDPTVQRSNDRLYWCVHTQTCIGPDNRVAEPENCAPGRACYEE